ncbi:sensor histidine kinase [Peterkaempfera griseoplana]|uniref:sensor histidine kinase n=1 Tax=Peterkaempfera griseoplana TaxID=66896 RepID=UPI0006E438AF|nr:HAMP domain-containing sensor histidine kinase [Peterkaempfera griseoplana]
MSLRNRVAMAGGLVVLAALVLASLVLYPSLGGELSHQHDSSLVSAAENDSDRLLTAFKFKAAKGEPVIPDKPVSVGNTLLQFIPAPVKVGSDTGFLPVTERDAEVADGTAAPYFQDAEHDGVRYRVYTAAPRGASGMLVRAALPQSVIGTTLGRLGALLVGITVGGGLLAALSARLVAGRVLRPVRQLTETVEHVTATQDLGARIDTRGRDEIARLARSFTAMMAALDESVQAQRRLVADASHELRTPLTSLTTNLELLDEGAGVTDPQAPALVRDARAQAVELRALLNDLVDLGRYERAQTHVEAVRLDLLAQRVVERASARTATVSLCTRLTECMVQADPDALERAVGNLVDNAVKWSPPGGRILVAVEADGAVTVADEGPGIPPADLPFVFDRFYRSPAARSLPGSGLGLAIVRQIAETHGGGVAAEPLERGVRMRLFLPVRAPDEPGPTGACDRPG